MFWELQTSTCSVAKYVHYNFFCQESDSHKLHKACNLCCESASVLWCASFNSSTIFFDVTPSLTHAYTADGSLPDMCNPPIPVEGPTDHQVQEALVNKTPYTTIIMPHVPSQD